MRRHPPAKSSNDGHSECYGELCALYRKLDLTVADVAAMATANGRESDLRCAASRRCRCQSSTDGQSVCHGELCALTT